MRLSHRTILITGGSNGIGLELAQRLIEKGNTVIITGRSEQALEKARSSLPGVEALRSDVTKPADISALYEILASRFPKLDTLVNNAGIMRILKVDEDHHLDDLTAEIDINLNGTIRMVQQFLPLLARQKDGLIINVSSGLAFVPFPISPVYSAAKAGVHAYTRCLRVQLKDTSVRVVELAPPLTETRLYQAEFSKKMNGRRGMTVDVLVRKAIASLEAGKTEIRPGQSNLLKIASRVAPGLIFREFSKVQ